ncbi:somatostatin 6 [Misgurnus anguillicaudatus]|uniref:somatostatin 6 n=1 Tax=Misgurnus anguillicaudatus TaxID=75329 RepID=UPI002435BDA7|nr:somatostatin 6 [Misgurnus anguillicaudatus]XP_055044248.1 somatostatin 6 [Misgurnus anguillicaudatus]XP_055044249.1 somatostatin 6 [Misgurnus anguillicaudatus]XP_055044250.1 somatostatin 6 [Misgurnus anguillicaudatus]
MMMGAGLDNRTDRSLFIMRVLLSLFPLVLMMWNSDSTEALPIQDKLARTNEILTEDEKDLLKKMVTDMAKMNLTSKELEDFDPEFLENKTIIEQPIPKDKSPCKLFFWKSFSSC